MEAVLAVYHRPYHPDFPVVCLDESLKQLVQETIQPMTIEPGQVKRYDYKYERNGTANLFMLCEPMPGTRQVKVTLESLSTDVKSAIFWSLLVDIVHLVPQSSDFIYRSKP